MFLAFIQSRSQESILPVCASAYVLVTTVGPATGELREHMRRLPEVCAFVAVAGSSMALHVANTRWYGPLVSGFGASSPLYPRLTVQNKDLGSYGPKP